jgi:GR25 family glycosyltransferase involved in LPS biosynthesis
MKPVHQILFINLPSRRDRFFQMLEQRPQLEQLSAHAMVKMTAFSTPFGGKGCARSHVEALQTAEDNKWPNVLILEDDFELSRPVEDVILALQALVEKEADWDVCMLAYGFNTIREFPKEAGVPYARIEDAQTTSAYWVNQKAYPALRAAFQSSFENLPDHAQVHNFKELYATFAADQVWKPLQKTLNWFALTPRAGKQRASFSDIEQRVTDYGV